ncbi:MAG: methyltransferase domain-containing protein [Candidatus Rokubacteria bacterium]|nr:methyltransferase domain-containing protein [Candidatus Rokubacteria bacterium]
MDTSARDFRRFDEGDDSAFYSFPRRVVHIDDGAIAALTRLYTALVPTGGRVLDLMGSWRSHLPASFGGTVIGLGLNAVEMAENPQLTAAVVHDLNREPGLPFAVAAFDAVMCAVAVQYLTRPLEVFREIRRVLRPGAPFVVSFSNRCFPDKAVALWRVTDDQEHVEIVTAYFADSAEPGRAWAAVETFEHAPRRGDPLYAVWARRAPGDSASLC